MKAVRNAVLSLGILALVIVAFIVIADAGDYLDLGGSGDGSDYRQGN